VYREMEKKSLKRDGEISPHGEREKLFPKEREFSGLPHLEYVFECLNMF
jgi:hypothetical protein